MKKGPTCADPKKILGEDAWNAPRMWAAPYLHVGTPSNDIDIAIAVGGLRSGAVAAMRQSSAASSFAMVVLDPPRGNG